MAAAGVPDPRPDHVAAAAEMALEGRECVSGLRWPSGAPVGQRIGIACGPVMAGVIGRRKFARDVWGDTVNTASRLGVHRRAGQHPGVRAALRSLPLLGPLCCTAERVRADESSCPTRTPAADLRLRSCYSATEPDRFGDTGVVTFRHRVARRFERVVLGTVMSMIAFIIERRLLKAVSGTGGKPLQPGREGEFAVQPTFRRGHG